MIRTRCWKLPCVCVRRSPSRPSICSSTANQLFKLAKQYAPEDKAAKKERITAQAKERLAASKAGKKWEASGKKPMTIKFGLNHVTELVEQKKATLVAIAHDVEPIELVVWLPGLCRKMDIPYCIVKGKARIGQVVHKKSSAVMAFTDIDASDKKAFADISGICKEYFNNDEKSRRTWGGGALGRKSTMSKEAKEAAIAKEAAKKILA